MKGVTLTTGLSNEAFLDGDFPRGAELIDGEVVVNDPGFRHRELAKRLLLALDRWCGLEPGRGRCGFGGNWTVGPGQTLKPDVWWVPEGSEPDGPRSDEPPALAVEVRSSNWHVDIGRKRRIYEDVGVAELWLVDTEARVIVLRRSQPGGPTFDTGADVGEHDTLTTPLLDGFELAVADLFAH